MHAYNYIGLTLNPAKVLHICRSIKMSTATLSKEDAWEAFKQVLKPQCQTIFTHAGLNIPFLVTPESIAEAASLPVDPSDVWIATYPKSGTTWTQNIVKLIRNKGEKMAFN